VEESPPRPPLPRDGPKLCLRRVNKSPDKRRRKLRPRLLRLLMGGVVVAADSEEAVLRPRRSVDP